MALDQINELRKTATGFSYLLYLDLAFKYYDKDGDGALNKQELLAKGGKINPDKEIDGDGLYDFLEFSYVIKDNDAWKQDFYNQCTLAKSLLSRFLKDIEDYINNKTGFERTFIDEIVRLLQQVLDGFDPRDIYLEYYNLATILNKLKDKTGLLEKFMKDWLTIYFDTYVLKMGIVPNAVVMPTIADYQQGNATGSGTTGSAPFLPSGPAFSVESMPALHMFESESVENDIANKALSSESIPASHLFETESLDSELMASDISNLMTKTSALNFDDNASVVNSVISGEEIAPVYCSVKEYNGIELPLTQADVNLDSLVSDKELWELSSMESEAMEGMNFDITDNDIDQFDWELSSTEM